MLAQVLQRRGFEVTVLDTNSLASEMTAEPTARSHWSYQASISPRFSRHFVKFGTRIGRPRPRRARSATNVRMFSSTPAYRSTPITAA